MVKRVHEEESDEMIYRVAGHVEGLNRITYVSDEEEGPASAGMLDCSLGINPLGCSPAAMQALEKASPPDVVSYPSFPYTALKRRISAYWRDTADIPEECIRLSAGAIGALDQINKLFVNANSKVFGYSPQFTDYINDVCGYGGSYECYRLPAEDGYRFDCESFLRRLSGNHALVYLDNPNNPTGQVIPIDEIREIVGRARELNVCVVIDEAYGDYMPQSNSAVSLVPHYENLFVVKSFSKGFGMAGLRCGYLVASKRLIEYYQRVEIPFSINTYGQAAVAAALGDRAFLEKSIRNTGIVKADLMGACRKLTCLATGAQTPIMVLKHPDDAVDLHEVFLRHRVVTEAGDGFLSLPRSAVRIRAPIEAQTLAAIISRIEAEM